MRTVLPADAYLRCSGKLHITMTSLVLGKPTAIVVSSFASNEELFEACIASSSVPLVTQRGIGTQYKNRRSFDGLFAGENVPCFTDSIRPQLVFDLGRVPYGPFA